MKRKLPALLAVILLMLSLTGCALFKSRVHELVGSIAGNTYTCEFYSNSGEKFMTMSGRKIDMQANIIKEHTYDSEGQGFNLTLSSVVTITIDGHQVENCGSTILFIEKGLKPDVDYMAESVAEIESSGHGLGSYTSIANIVNRFKNAYGKAVVVVIQSQLGDPICAFSGDKVYWEVVEDLPKMTKLMIDGKALYIHRANFQIIDKALIKDE